MSTPYPVVGAAVALAGADKLLGDRGYEGVFHHLGWSDDALRRLGAGEVAGGLLMTLRPTRRLGALIVLIASSAVLMAELEKGEFRLAGSRAGVLTAALGALAFPGRRRRRTPATA